MGNNEIVKPVPDNRISGESLGVRVLSAIGGFMAMVFLLLFLYVCKIFDSPLGLIVVGSLFVASAILESRLIGSLLLRTAGIMLYLTGSVLLGIGLSRDLSLEVFNVILAFVGLLTLGILRKGALVFFAILLFWGSGVWLVWEYGTGMVWLLAMIQALALTYIYLYESGFRTFFRVPVVGYAQFRNGALVSFLATLMAVVYYPRWEPYATDLFSPWVATVLLMLLVVFVFLRMLRTVHGDAALDSRCLWKYGGCCVVALLPLLFFPAAIGMILVIVLGFFVRHRVGFILGALCLVEVVGQLYYDLNATLLLKSLFLTGSGVLFLLLFWIVRDRK